MSRAEEIPSTIRSKLEEERCAKQELSGQRLSKECLSTSRLASILNKAEIIVDYNEVTLNQNSSKFYQFLCKFPLILFKILSKLP
jgi:hypothetical protein